MSDDYITHTTSSHEHIDKKSHYSPTVLFTLRTSRKFDGSVCCVPTSSMVDVESQGVQIHTSLLSDEAVDLIYKLCILFIKI